MALLEAINVTKIFGSKNIQYRALDSLHIEMEKGEFIGIMGPSGSGKTTLLNLLSTIDKPTSGLIKINNLNVSSLSKKELALFRRKQLGFIFQDFNLLNTLTIEENIILPLTLDNRPLKEMDENLVRVSKQLNIDSILKKRIYEVSGGQQQRTAIARAIIHNPSIVFADEPTGNLDSKSSKDVMEALQTMNQEQQVSILMVTHDPIAASYCQRILFIKDGQLFNEIHRGSNRQAFFQDILDVLSLLGGNANEFSSIRSY
ncbi:ABC transporter ATP-binding protein [Bacillus sp. JJ722]|uniref:ABC transporter ATP-binding protein n=1 Tax=Bacillus sp. JJ722 TaxID=3122973 RepID=UPI002FFE674F